jgi:phage tail sheath protein FI
MASLVSPGVTTQLIDQSLFVPSIADTVPLFFVATQQSKKQTDGVSTALGTIESNVVRTVTSLKQSLSLYGVPSFLTSSNGAAMHGDARNEVGLFTLNRFLGIGSLAYVVRANVNTNDEYAATSASWTTKTSAAAAELQSLASAYINAYNLQNGYTDMDTLFKSTVTNVELSTFIHQVMSPIFAENTFKKTEFDFYDNNLSPSTSSRGNQTVSFNGGLTPTTATGFGTGAAIHSATIVVDGVSHIVELAESVMPTAGDLVTQLNAKLGAAAIVDLYNGNIRITSGSTGSTSSILIIDGSGAGIFSMMNGFHAVQLAISGINADKQLDVFANGFNQLSSSQYAGIEGIIALWSDPALHTTIVDPKALQWTPKQAHDMLVMATEDFKATAEFSNATSLGASDAEKRQTIVTALQAVINSNTEVRSELYEYNLIVCPGFAEVVDDMLTLCEDIGEEAFVIGDVPYQLDPEAAANWAVAPASQSDSRRVSRNVAYYYPHAIASNVDGNDVFVPASAIALRTYAYSDQQSEVWFAPAGARRGTVTGISRIGYVSGILGQPTTFVDVALNKGQRDALYQYFSNINPIANLPGRGILVFGQKTSQNVASALDRVNVARLTAYIRRQARKLGFGFLFEPNDTITRANFKSAIDGMLSTIMTSRGLVDYLTVCDSSNNTAARIGANEMYLDIAIKPMIAAEFIIIPITVKSQGASLSATA